MIYKNKYLSISILICIIFLSVGPSYSQFYYGLWLGRAKMTTTHAVNFSSATGVPGQGDATYPGYEHSPFSLQGGDGTTLYVKHLNAEGTADTTVSTVCFANQPGVTSEIEAPVLHKNYNFENSTTDPEEWITARLRYGLEFIDCKSKVMAWAHPKYDDFVLYEVELINISDITVKDVRWAYWTGLGQNQNGFSRDEKYLWNEERNMFVFYDDRTFDWTTGRETEYTFASGPFTGDAGDPGDIKVENGIRHELLSPTVYSVANILAPLDKNGNKGFHYNIVHSGSLQEGTPPREDHFLRQDPPNEILRKLTIEQASMSWDEASKDPAVEDGTKWEREPVLILAYGPYDLAPGESRKIIYGFFAGQMSRDKIHAGGLENIQKVPLPESYTYPGSTLNEIWTFVKFGLDEIYNNYDAAVELINNNYAISDFPPPTVGPEKGDLLSVVSEPGNLKVSFPPIPESYIDPGKGNNDVAGYRIYRSPISLVGPWEKVGEIQYSQQNQFKDAEGNILFVDESPEPGIGYHYTVSSYDSDGNESTPVVYNRFMEFTQVAPGLADGSGTVVIPNPFRIVADYQASSQQNRITFMNVPSICTIRIYNVAGELIRKIEHDDGSGEQAWGSSTNEDLQLRKYFKRVAPGIYVYLVESKVAGHEGETSIGKFAIIR